MEYTILPRKQIAVSIRGILKTVGLPEVETWGTKHNPLKSKTFAASIYYPDKDLNDTQNEKFFQAWFNQMLSSMKVNKNYINPNTIRLEFEEATQEDDATLTLFFETSKFKAAPTRKTKQ